MSARETKRLSVGGFIPFCYKSVIQILPIQTFISSAETLIERLLQRLLSIFPNKRVSRKFPVAIVIFSCKFVKKIKNY